MPGLHRPPVSHWNAKAEKELEQPTPGHRNRRTPDPLCRETSAPQAGKVSLAQSGLDITRKTTLSSDKQTILAEPVAAVTEGRPATVPSTKTGSREKII